MLPETDAYLTMLGLDREGFVAVAFGYGGHWEDNGKGVAKYQHKRWVERRYRWPNERHDMVLDAEREQAAERVDVYICPAVRFTNDRRKGSAMPPTLLWADLDYGDGEADQGVQETVQPLLDTLDPTIVLSGSHGHRHVYVRLSRPVDLGTHARLNKALAERLGGDAKWSDDSLLRLPGTPNHKVGDPDSPTLVRLEREPGPNGVQGTVWDVDELAELLDADLSGGVGTKLGVAATETGPGATGSAPASTGALEPEAVDLAALSGGVRRWFTPEPPEDASEAFYGLIGACRDDPALSIGQALTIAQVWPHTPVRYGSRLAGEVARCWDGVTTPLHELADSILGEPAPPPSPDEAIGAVPDGGTDERPPIVGAGTQKLDDAHLVAEVCSSVLRDRYCYVKAFGGWMSWDGRRWGVVGEEVIAEQIRQVFIAMLAEAARHSGEDEGVRVKALGALLTKARITAIATLARGILVADASGFDQRADLLNVANGVVDLRTGELLEHAPRYLFTKLTDTPYAPGATHRDWDKALLALPADVRPWMQVRLGQAVTGHMTPDDVMPVCQGGGQNGKSTLFAGIAKTLGEHATIVPEKLLMTRDGDHPTELTTLRGARFAMLEEAPDQHLSVKRLKDVLGTPMMTARQVHRDNVTWNATHSLFLTTNYRLRVDESDQATWRRLALVRFPYTFDGGNEASDAGLRPRIEAGEDGQHEAILAWIVAGAVSWYAGDRAMPPLPERVVADTAEWRGEADRAFAYIRDRLIFDPRACALCSDVYADMAGWLNAHGYKEWNDQTVALRLGGHPQFVQHGVTKEQSRDLSGLSARIGDIPARVTGHQRIWRGIRFARMGEDGGTADSWDEELSRGVPGVSKSSQLISHEGSSTAPGHPGTDPEFRGSGVHPQAVDNAAPEALAASILGAELIGREVGTESTSSEELDNGGD